MTNSQISVTEGSGKNIGSYSISETTTKELQRMALNNSSGTEIGTATNPLAVSGISSISGTVGASIIGTVPVTGSVAISSVVGTLPVSGTVGVSSVTGAVLPYAQPDSFVSGVTSVITGTASVLVLAAPSASLRNHATHIMATNAAATATFVNIVDNGQIIYVGYAAASGGGFSATLPVALRQTTSGLGLFVSTPTQASVIVSISGYKA